MNGRDELKTVIANHVKIITEAVPSDSELNNYADNLLSFFEILIEADKKLMKTNDSSNNRNPNIAN